MIDSDDSEIELPKNRAVGVQHIQDNQFMKMYKA